MPAQILVELASTGTLINPLLIELAQYVVIYPRRKGGNDWPPQSCPESDATHLRLTMASGEQHIVTLQQYAAVMRRWAEAQRRTLDPAGTSPAG